MALFIVTVFTLVKVMVKQSAEFVPLTEWKMPLRNSVVLMHNLYGKILKAS